jgi:hypothetical protein
VDQVSVGDTIEYDCLGMKLRGVVVDVTFRGEWVRVALPSGGSVSQMTHNVRVLTPLDLLAEI